MSNDLENSSASLSQIIDRPVLNDCWNKIGVMGDRSCPELKNVIHCHECQVFAAVGDSLLEREPPLNYVDEWISVLEETPVDEETQNNETIIKTASAISVMIFRLGNEQLALSAKVLQEVTHPCVIQPLPHRSNELFLGLVNIRGETLLCASLSNLLNLNLESIEEKSSTPKSVNTQRMMVAGYQNDKWVFPVDEVYGIYRFHLNELRDAPVVIAKAAQAYTQGIINWQTKKVNCLDFELLFYTLNSKIL
ncbi:MAG: chemotaxis protein CheW [Nostoc sp.]|uniref:chemotaxis protein CheW n=1 Tax=Nostoc sp. TaxID=1180 RepID=UPI002FFC5C2B